MYEITKLPRVGDAQHESLGFSNDARVVTGVAAVGVVGVLTLAVVTTVVPVALGVWLWRRSKKKS